MRNRVEEGARPPWLRYLAIGGTAVVLGVAITASTIPDKSEWPCKDFMSLHGDGEGDATEAQARERAVLVLTNLAPAFPASRDQAMIAVRSSTGPDRYDAETGVLFIDDYIAATFTIDKLGDGTYQAGTITTCAPQSDGEGGPTPTGV
jgi:hypothetical protein